MDRLTARTHDGHAYLANVKDDEQEVECRSRNTAQCIMDSWEHLAAYEDTGLAPEEITPRLRELAQADREGRIVVLPCKVGDTVFEIAKGLSIYKAGLYPYVYEHTATEINIFNWLRYGDFGKTVFLTRAEAEEALKKEAGNG